MTDLSILIPSRNEQFLARTIQDILEHIRGDTEIVAVCDGVWPTPSVDDHPRVHLIYHPVPIGQRAATNEAARVSTAKYLMKLDAHSAVDEGFDEKLMAPYESGELAGDVTTIPRMYNLHAFDWVCQSCGARTYQGPRRCEKCKGSEVTMDIVWQPRWSRKTDFARFDHDLHFQYWGSYGKRPEAQGDLADVLCSVGACWFMPRARFLEIGGMDEAHGFWGQYGVEVACKSWLSGGRQVVNKRTWFSHMFRTRPEFGFPYPISGGAQERAREYSRRMWNLESPSDLPRWDKAVRQLAWLVQHFAPVPDWPEVPETPETPPPAAHSAPTRPFQAISAPQSHPSVPGPSVGVVYYTDDRLDERIARVAQTQLRRAAAGLEIVSVSLKSLDFGRNIVLDLERGPLTMFRQILAGLEASTAEIVFFAEHDCLYHAGHFEFRPLKPEVFYYNRAVWKVDSVTGRTLHYDCDQTSGLCAYRELLLKHYRERVRRVEAEGFSRRMGYEPGTHGRAERVDDFKSAFWFSAIPNIDIRHGQNLTRSRWQKTEFRNQRFTVGWTEGTGVPGWGETFGHFAEFLKEVESGLAVLELC